MSGRVESVAYYPHPFTAGGLLVVPKQDVGFVPDFIAEIYSYSPPNMMLNCLRRNELFELSQPGLFGWPRPLEEKPHLAFWLKNRGTILYGLDIREDIELPSDTSSFLEDHILRCKQFIRNWSLDQLRRKNYGGMVKELKRQSDYLMATALLTRGQWEVTQDQVAERFHEMFDDARARQIHSELAGLVEP
ncbi:MAG: hypothetical protein ACREDR_17385, partial [Blastocatellia bacterium]